MKKTARNCTIVYPLYNAIGSTIKGNLTIKAIITESEETFLDDDSGIHTEYDVVITSIKQDKEELLPLLKALDAIFQIQRVIDARARRYFQQNQQENQRTA